MTLRHDPKDMNIPIDDQGFIYIPDMLLHPRFSSFNYTQEQIVRQAQLNSAHNKDRFLRKGDYIATRSGHSVRASGSLGASSSNARVSNAPLLAAVDVPTVLCHGTYEGNVESVLLSRRLGRHTRLPVATSSLQCKTWFLARKHHGFGRHFSSKSCRGQYQLPPH